MNEFHCNVVERKDTWPYAQKCKSKAEWYVNPSYRDAAGGVVYICKRHSDEMVISFGNDSVDKLASTGE